jgi:DNA polymerase IV (DinB-like DNA polymerase)
MLIDMDYFFAACEELRNPKIKGHPVIVGTSSKKDDGRGVVSTCNYEARKFGIHSAMPIFAAYKLNQNLIYIPIDIPYYEEISAKIMAIIKSFANQWEQASIDEIYIDVSDKIKKFEDSIKYAEQIKNRIMKEIGITCTIGISYNKLLAKMASDIAKPNGIKMIKPEDAKEFLAKMPVGKLYGVGKKTEEKLKKEGFNTVDDISKSTKIKMRELFGAFGIEMHNYANGIDESEVQEISNIKSLSREATFERDTVNKKEIEKKIRDISEMIITEIKKYNFGFKTVTLKIRYSNFIEHMKSRSLSHYSQNIEDIIENASALLEEYAEADKKIRKIGIKVSKIVSYKGQQFLK